MTPDQYQDLCLRTESMVDINTLVKTRLLHAVCGIQSEGGEIADTVKRHIYYGQPLDDQNLKEEVGDLLWYAALICNAIDVSLSEVMRANIAKLETRFPDKFSEELAAEKNRDREAEAAVLSEESANSYSLALAINKELKSQYDRLFQFTETVISLLDGQDYKKMTKEFKRINKDA